MFESIKPGKEPVALVISDLAILARMGVTGVLPFPPVNTGIAMAVAAISPSPKVVGTAAVALGMRPMKELGLYKATLQSRAGSLSVHAKLSGTSKVSGG